MHAGIAMSGGIKSSLAAILMKKVGYEITGITVRFVSEKDKYSRDNRRLSYYPENIIAAKRIAKQYDFIHEIVDLEINTSKMVETPGKTNQNHKDIENELILERAAEYAVKAGCSRLAAGHYARIIKKKNEIEIYNIISGLDDDAEMNLMLSQDLISFLIFPLGEYHKTAIKKYAREYGLCDLEIYECENNCCFD